MHPDSLPANDTGTAERGQAPATWQDDLPGQLARHAGTRWLAQALQASRRDTLATFAAWETALPDLQVPRQAGLNPPLWELGHIGWFQSYWLGRFSPWRLGNLADPEAPRREDRQHDSLYHSSQVPHDSRWTLPLPGAQRLRAWLQQGLDETLALLAQVDDSAPDRDQALYFFRLALLHEDMHHEAALYMARGMGLPLTDPRWAARSLPPPAAPLTLEAGPWRLGSEPGAAGFAFDNERCAHTVALAPCTIDAQVLRWAEYLPFIDSGAHAEAHWWSPAGLAWKQRSGASAPRHLRRDGHDWQQWQHGQWQALDLSQAAVHLSCHEAEAWCRWAGRRLPTEAEWERAALTAGPAFHWGEVWEWTASPFVPYPGFAAHPYRDYSAPWFDGRPVLKGASMLTQARVRHPRYRNYFEAHRSDVPAGFRSCAR